MKKEEVQRLVFAEMQKRMDVEEFMYNMTKNIQKNSRLMQQILDEHPEWGYKVIINDAGYFKLIQTQ